MIVITMITWAIRVLLNDSIPYPCRPPCVSSGGRERLSRYTQGGLDRSPSSHFGHGTCELHAVRTSLERATDELPVAALVSTPMSASRYNSCPVHCLAIQGRAVPRLRHLDTPMSAFMSASVYQTHHPKALYPCNHCKDRASPRVGTPLAIDHDLSPSEREIVSKTGDAPGASPCLRGGCSCTHQSP